MKNSKTINSAVLVLIVIATFSLTGCGASNQASLNEFTGLSIGGPNGALTIGQLKGVDLSTVVSNDDATVKDSILAINDRTNKKLDNSLQEQVLFVKDKTVGKILKNGGSAKDIAPVIDAMKL